jgi:hypothetical protein
MTEYKHVQRPDSFAISLDVEVVLGSMMLTAILLVRRSATKSFRWAA